MSRMSELSQMIDSLISCGETLAETGRALKAYYSSDEEPAAPAVDAKPAAKSKPKKEEAPKEAPAAKQYSKEDIRGMLAAKANESDGRFKAAVKALVKKYAGGGSLKDIPQECYPDVVKEVEGLTDA